MFKDFKIVERIATLRKTPSGWAKELNLVKWGGKDPQYDLRTWNSDHTKMSKGVSLTKDEAAILSSALNPNLARIIACTIYVSAVNYTEDGGWVEYYDDLKGYFHTGIAPIAEDIANCLRTYAGVAEVTVTDNSFDLMLYGHYCGLDE